MSKLIFLIPVLSVLLLASCGSSNEEDAFSSLLGNWKVTKVIESKTQLVNGIPSNTDNREWNGDLGTCVFSESLMDYFIELDQVRSLSQNFTFVRSRENSGFVKVDVYTIKGSQEDFRVRYGDETSDAHEDANMIVLQSKETVSDSLETETWFTLVK